MKTRQKGPADTASSQLTGRIFEIKRFAVHDGPGIRTTVFFKGCPLQCVWCHNPEGIAPAPEAAFLERKCIGCGECYTACPHALHSLNEDGIHIIDREKCVLCFACARACLPGALKRYGEEYTAGQLFELVSDDIDFYKESGGGVTCCGGEPLMQPDFVAAFLALCKAGGLHTAVDTSGYAPRGAFEKVLPFTDLFLYDLKHMDTAEHQKHTGAGNRLILENLRFLSQNGAPVEVRMMIVPGFNDGEENILHAAAFLKELRALTAVRLLPCHALSGTKYSSIGRKNTLPIEPASSGTLQRVAQILIREGIEVKQDEQPSRPASD